MDVGVTGFIRLFAPKIPLILRTFLARSLWLSETASDWDFRTEITIKIMRSFFENPKPSPMSKLQNLSLIDSGIKGRKWIAKVTLPKPPEEDSDVREQLFKAFDGLKEGGETYTVPELLPVEAEWTGYRAGVDTNAPQLDISEEEKYQRLMNEVESDVTILYFHGGAYYLCDPATHRPSTVRLAKLTKGRCFSVRYRLAPQNPFPAGLLDALVAYISLLYPPPDSLHSPVPSSHIIFSGDSAGGGLSMALLQLLLELHRQTPTPTIQWYGSTKPIPLPAGVATNSGWFDVTHSLPSIFDNYKYDYLPHPTHVMRTRYQPDSIWPTTPPRNNIYANDDCLLHPLVSPITAPDWSNAPPLLFLTGEEQLSDENRLVASRAMSSAPNPPIVIYEEYTKLPHVFCQLLSPGRLPASRKCYEDWARFCRDCVEMKKSRDDGAAGSSSSLLLLLLEKSKVVIVDGKTCKETEVDDVGELWKGEKDVEVIKRGMRVALARRYAGSLIKEGAAGDGDVNVNANGNGNDEKRAEGAEVIV